MGKKSWTFCDPQGKEHTFSNLKKFFQSRNLEPRIFYSVGYGFRDSYLGWTCLKCHKRVPRTAADAPPAMARPLDIMEQQEIYLMGRAGVQIDRIAAKFNIPVRSVSATMAHDPREKLRRVRAR